VGLMWWGFDGGGEKGFGSKSAVGVKHSSVFEGILYTFGCSNGHLS